MKNFINRPIQQNTPEGIKPKRGRKFSFRRQHQPRRLSDAGLQALLLTYQQGDSLVSEIAKQFSVSPATVSQIARATGLTLRGRGRRCLSEPSVYHRKVLRQAWMHTYEVVAGHQEQAVNLVYL